MDLMEFIGLVMGLLAAVSLWYRWDGVISGICYTFFLTMLIPLHHWLDELRSTRDYRELKEVFEIDSLTFTEYIQIIDHYENTATIWSLLKDNLITLYSPFSSRFPWILGFSFYGLFSFPSYLLGFFLTSVGFYAFFYVYSSLGRRTGMIYRTHFMYALRRKDAALKGIQKEVKLEE